MFLPLWKLESEPEKRATTPAGCACAIGPEERKGLRRFQRHGDATLDSAALPNEVGFGSPQNAVLLILHPGSYSTRPTLVMVLLNPCRLPISLVQLMAFL